MRLFLLIFFVLIIAVADPSKTHASGSWTSGTFTFGERKEIRSQSPLTSCTVRQVTIIGVGATPSSVVLCVYDRPSFRYAVWNKYTDAGYMSYSTPYFLVGIGSDRLMYVVNGINGNDLPLDVPSSDDLHFNNLTMGFTNNHLLSYIPKFHTKLQKVMTVEAPLRYELISSAFEPLVKTTNGSTITTGAVGVSSDGDWLAMEVMGDGFVLMNTHTHELNAFSRYKHSYGYGSDAHIRFVISNDGNHVAAFDYNITPVVYTLTDSCVTKSNIYSAAFSDAVRNNSCPTDEYRLHNALVEKYGYQLARSMSAVEFNQDNDTLYFEKYEYDGTNWANAKLYQIPLHAANYIEEEGVKYLALGDSYASGEGDIEKKADGSTYYREGTEVKGQCHQSSRSYPYVLSSLKDIPIERIRSVACSGAEVFPDYIGNSADYKGQNERISAFSASDRIKQQNKALTDFTPGITPQIEFVKRYKPEVLTVMGGGNDVGFAEILRYCASPTWQGVFTDDTCGYAVRGHQLQSMLARAIRSQYSYTKLLISKIRQASPNTKVYVVGYPSFINSGTAVCMNSAALDSEERLMINQGVAYMNKILKQASDESGVAYVDIEDSLAGGRMCEGSEYVTGLMNIDINKLASNDNTEMFHPNAAAHHKFAEIIARAFNPSAVNMTASTTMTDIQSSEYFESSENTQTKQQAVTPNDVIKQQSSMPLNLADGQVAAGSTITINAYSDPTTIGTATANAAGGLDAKIALPSSLGVGRHVLSVSAESPTGEPIEFYQFLTVVADTINDADGDGISDSSDKCLFISSWIDEVTGKNICEQTDELGAHTTNDEVLVKNTKPQAVFSGSQDALEGSAGEYSLLADADTAIVQLKTTIGKVKSHADNIVADGSEEAVTQQLSANTWPGSAVLLVGSFVSAICAYGIIKVMRNKL